MEPLQPPLENYDKKHLQQPLTLVKIHKQNPLQLLRFISCFCLELWGGDHCGEHRPWQTRVLTVQLSLEACSKDPACLFGMRCADTFVSDSKLHEGYHTKLRWHTCHPVMCLFFSSRGSQETAAWVFHPKLWGLPKSGSLLSRFVTRGNDVFPLRIWILVRFISKPSSR